MRVAIVANTKKEGARAILPRFIGLLSENGIEVFIHDGIREIISGNYNFKSESELFSGADMIISFGGDGTILYTARIAANTGVPILGVNLGKVGFLAEVSPDEITAIPKKLITGDYEIIDRMAFLAAKSTGEKYFALNDIVFDRNADTRIITLCMYIDNNYAGEFTADGLIVSTPTGSTAHSVSAGGPLVMPDCEVIILTPICPHSLTIRPMILDSSKTVSLKILDGRARMAVDGQNFVDIAQGSEVIIKKAEHPVRVARFREKTYFDILHTRLNWGVSLKLKNA